MAADAELAALDADATTRRALPVVYLGVGGFYLLLALLSPLLVEPGRAGASLALRWALSGLVGVFGGVVFLRRPAPSGWANALVGALGLLTVLNSLALVAAAGPGFVFAMTVALVGFALFLLSMPWAAGLCAVGLGGWLLLAWQAGGGPEWTPRTINLLAVCALALIAQAMRLGLHRRLASMKRRDVERARLQHELEREAALGEQRRRILLDTAHELSTPMTPIVLQAHLLAQADLPPEARRQVEILRRNLERLQAAVASAIDAARRAEAAAGRGPDVGALAKGARGEGTGGEASEGEAGGGGTGGGTTPASRAGLSGGP